MSFLKNLFGSPSKSDLQQQLQEKEAEIEDFIKTINEKDCENEKLIRTIKEIEIKSQEQEKILDSYSEIDKKSYEYGLSLMETQRKLEKETLDLHLEIENNGIRIQDQNKIIDDLQKKIIELRESVLMQEVGLYTPNYNFSNSAQYKEKLNEIRNRQKEMVKNKSAVSCPTTWYVNDSKQEGQRMINKNIKHTLFTFNAECENIIGKVKFGFFESYQERIERIAEKIDNWNDDLGISISQEYLDLKIEELKLAYEYILKKQEEKEYIREQREIAKENARVQKELEEARQKIEKEQRHYQNQLEQLNVQYLLENSEAKKEWISEKINLTEAELEKLRKALEDVDYRQANERAGYVYVISNVGSFGENVFKIGMTRRLDPQDRIDELGGASVPFRFDVHAMIFSSDAPKLETILHNTFADKKVNMVNGRKEFFNVTLEEIEEVIKKNYDKTVDFTYVPTAQQYRETMALKKAPPSGASKNS